MLEQQTRLRSDFWRKADVLDLMGEIICLELSGILLTVEGVYSGISQALELLNTAECSGLCDGDDLSFFI